MIHDGEGEDVKDEDLFGKPKPHRPKAAYYKNIERKMVLKKKRVDVSLLFSCNNWFDFNHPLLHSKATRYLSRQMACRQSHTRAHVQRRGR